MAANSTTQNLIETEINRRLLLEAQKKIKNPLNAYEYNKQLQARYKQVNTASARDQLRQQISQELQTGKLTDLTPRGANLPSVQNKTQYAPQYATPYQSTLAGSIQQSITGEYRTIKPGQQTKIDSRDYSKPARPDYAGVQQSTLAGSIAPTQYSVGGFVTSQKAASKYEQGIQDFEAEQRKVLFDSAIKRYQENKKFSAFTNQAKLFSQKAASFAPVVRIPKGAEYALQTVKSVGSQLYSFGKEFAIGAGQQIEKLSLFKLQVPKAQKTDSFAPNFASAAIALSQAKISPKKQDFFTAPLSKEEKTFQTTLAIGTASVAVPLAGTAIGAAFAGKAIKSFAQSPTPSRAAGVIITLAPFVPLATSGVSQAAFAVRARPTAATAVFEPRALRVTEAGGRAFPVSSSPARAFEKFKTSVTPTGEFKTYTAGPKPLSRKGGVVTVQAGERGLKLKEDPGLFVSAGSQGASPRFLRIPQNLKQLLAPATELSLFPAPNKPTVARILAKDVQRQPSAVIAGRRGDFTKSAEFLKEQAGTGVAFQTRRSTIGQTSETEAVFPVGERLQVVTGGKQFTFVRGALGIPRFVRVETLRPIVSKVSPNAALKEGVLKRLSQPAEYSSEGLARRPASGSSVVSSSSRVSRPGLTPELEGSLVSYDGSPAIRRVFYPESALPSSVPYGLKSSGLPYSVAPPRRYSSAPKSARSSSSSKSYGLSPSKSSFAPSSKSSSPLSKGSSFSPSKYGGGSSRSRGGSSSALYRYNGGSSFGFFIPNFAPPQQREFGIAFAPPKGKKKTKKTLAAQQPRKYSPTLYAATFGIKHKGKLKTKGFTGLEVRPL